MPVAATGFLGRFFPLLLPRWTRGCPLLSPRWHPALLTPPSPYTCLPDPQQLDLSLFKSSFCCLHRFAGGMCIFRGISFFPLPQNHNYTARQLPARNLPPASPAEMWCWAAPPAPPKAFALVPAAVGAVLTPGCFCRGAESPLAPCRGQDACGWRRAGFGDVVICFLAGR